MWWGHQDLVRSEIGRVRFCMTKLAVMTGTGRGTRREPTANGMVTEACERRPTLMLHSSTVQVNYAKTMRSVLQCSESHSRLKRQLVEDAGSVTRLLHLTRSCATDLLYISCLAKQFSRCGQRQAEPQLSFPLFGEQPSRVYRTWSGYHFQQGPPMAIRLDI